MQRIVHFKKPLEEQQKEGQRQPLLYLKGTAGFRELRKYRNSKKLDNDHSTKMGVWQ